MVRVPFVTPRFCVLRMSKVPRLPHILRLVRAPGGGPFFKRFRSVDLLFMESVQIL